ncbi:hypothetical protein [Xanthocytophaga flava]|uniref:hypothetical protein n=1 Tax=Xanthocytophaga flava TaxID=3048013 RepID=UPI0028D5FF3A|nr:hypothetical protein [Xanthocytophaga flavus]MDJ1471156.1 hypothetical protein [Xanthocytophaga flavus]
MNFEIISETEAWDRYDLFSYWSVDYFSFGKNNFLAFDSAVSIVGDWNVSLLCEQHKVAGVIINGDLTVSGHFDMSDSLVLIKGNLKARHVCISEKEACITGNCIVSGLVYGGWKHGIFTVQEEICALFLIYEFDRASFGSIHPDIITIDNDFNSGCKGNYTYFWHELNYVFLPKLHVFASDGSFSGLDLSLMMEVLNHNEPVMNITPRKLRMYQDCFSTDNFDKAYGYLSTLLNPFIELDGFEVSILDVDQTSRLDFKKEGYSLGFISKERGIIALAKRQQDNDQNRKAIEQTFCNLINFIESGRVDNF